MRAAAKDKWLEVHGIEHWTHFYTDYGRELQLRFFDHFLHGKDNGWDKQPQVLLQVRHVDKFVERAENEWPLARTQVDQALPRPGERRARREKRVGGKAVMSFDAMGDGVTFLTAPLDARDRDHRAVGAEAVRLVVDQRTPTCSSCCGCSPATCKEVVFQGAIDPHTPVGQGWLRASHRKLDKKLSTPYRPYHTHDQKQPLKPGEVVELDIEIWPTSIVVPAGHRIGAHRPRQGLRLSAVRAAASSRTSRTSSPAAGRSCTTTRATGRRRSSAAPPACISAPARQPYLLLPIIPPQESGSAQARRPQ